MKKAVSLIFALLLLFCSLAFSANAEEFNGADLFTIDLPEEFEQTGTGDSGFNFENDNGDTFTVSYSDNTDEEYIFCPADMSKKDIEEYTNALSEESENVMKAYADDFELKFLSSEKIKHKNGKTAFDCKTKTSITKGEETKVYYQTMYEFGGIQYKYTFTYTTADEDRKDSFDQVFDSINIVEAETTSKLDNLSGYAGAGIIVLLVVIGIIKFVRTPEKREKGKI